MAQKKAGKVKRLFRKLERAVSIDALKPKQKILFAVRGDNSDIHAFKYALNMCKRVNAHLDILYVSKDAGKLLRQFQSELKREGIEYNLIHNNGSLDDAIKNYTNMYSDLLFVAVEVEEGVNIDSKKADRILSEAGKKLECPLVVISKAKTA